MSDAQTKTTRLALDRSISRLARSDDNEALCALFRQTAMKSDVDVVFIRDPDFFALYEMQQTRVNAFVFEDADTGSIEAHGSAQFRDGYVFGEKTRVAYLGDLRMTRRVRGGAFLNEYFSKELRKMFEREKCDIGLTVILRKNAAARFALVRRRTSQPDAPVYTKIRGYSITNVFMLRAKKIETSFSARRAEEGDAELIRKTLDEDHKKRAFGYDFSGDLLEHRLAEWPGLTLSDFFLVFRGDELHALCAPWNSKAVKRLQVGEYRGSFLKTKRQVNATRWFTGAVKLPKAGECFSYETLTHLYVKDQNPEAFAALFGAVYNASVKKDLHFLSVYIEDNSPFMDVLKPYQKTCLEADLYSVTLAGNPKQPREIHEPLGFEMALV